MKKALSYMIICLIIPLTVWLGAVFVFVDKQYAWVSLCVSILACVPFFLHFEKKENDTRQLVLISVMVALSVVGRILFTPIPGFKPVTAIVVLTAMYFGGEAGFMTGALSAVISNFYFGQGPWTPFQMFSWGIIGLLAGLLTKPLKKSKICLCIYGAAAGVLFSFLMDIWTVLWQDGFFNISRYLAAIVTATQFTVEYAVSNVIFLLLLGKPIGKVLERIKTKYGM